MRATNTSHPSPSSINFTILPIHQHSHSPVPSHYHTTQRVYPTIPYHGTQQSERGCWRYIHNALQSPLICRQLIVVHTAVHHDSTRLLLTKYTRHVWTYTLDPHEKRFEFELYRYGGILSEYGGMLAGAESYHIALLQNSTLEYCIYYISVFTTISVYCCSLFDRSSHDLSINTYFTHAIIHIHLVIQITLQSAYFCKLINLDAFWFLLA
jgi:hypothetical protein